MRRGILVSVAIVLYAGSAIASDGYVYNAPQAPQSLSIDGMHGDWPSDDVLAWEPITLGSQPKSPEDFTASFKMMWGYAGPEGDVPVLYILVRWIDDEIHLLTPEEGASWDSTDVFQFWLCETCVTEQLTPALALGPDLGWLCGSCDADGATDPGLSKFRQSNVFIGEASQQAGPGVRVWGPGSEGWQVDGNMPYSMARVHQVSDTEAYIEEQWQLFHTYPDRYLEIAPGETAIPLGIAGANDYDSYDGSWTYMVWGDADHRLGSLSTVFSDVMLMPSLNRQ
jgi:hypothetical protein